MDNHRAPRHCELLTLPLRVYSFPSAFIDCQGKILYLYSISSASVDVGAVLLQFLSAQGEILRGVFSLLCSL